MLLLLAVQIGAVERYSDPDWLQGLLTRVRVMLGLSADTHFTIVSWVAAL